MSKSAHFKVDPRLATLLGDNYRSTEAALKELVDNAFDADAENVFIELPEIFTLDPIVVRDNGSGMTEDEIREEYLKVASSRFSRKGERTALKKRLVKGRKGIGKFAGLMVAEEMEISSVAMGMKTTLLISRSGLSKANYDLEKISLPIHSEPAVEPSGTSIILRGLNDNLSFPNPDKLKQLLILEYGRIDDFQLTVNGEPVDIQDIPGKTFFEELQLPLSGKVQLKYIIAEQKKLLKQAGLTVMVQGRAIGQPQLFGLEDSERVPQSMIRRLIGEVIADDLAGDVTADWGAIIENSKAYAELSKSILPVLEKSFEQTYEEEVQFARARLQRKIQKGIEKLPPFRKAFARKALDKVMLKFFGEPEDKISAITSIVLETFEKDDYWVATENIRKARKGDAGEIAHALREFGQTDQEIAQQQVSNRLKTLQDIELLTNGKKVDGSQILEVVKQNLWIFGSHGHVLATNEALKKVLEGFLGLKFPKDVQTDRPSLLLTRTYDQTLILIETKPTHKRMDNADESRAHEYLAELNRLFPKNKTQIWILGKGFKIGTSLKEKTGPVSFQTYKSLLTEARKQLTWLGGES